MGASRLAPTRTFCLGAFHGEEDPRADQANRAQSTAGRLRRTRRSGPMNKHPIQGARQSERLTVSAWFMAIVGLVAVFAAGCGGSVQSSTFLLGVWHSTDTNVEPAAILVVKFATNGQGALFGGQKGDLAIPFSYRLAGDRVLLAPRMPRGEAIPVEVRYDRASDTISWAESQYQTRLVRKADFPLQRTLDAVIGATNEIEATLRAAQAAGYSSNLLQQFQKVTNR